MFQSNVRVPTAAEEEVEKQKAIHCGTANTPKALWGKGGGNIWTPLFLKEYGSSRLRKKSLDETKKGLTTTVTRRDLLKSREGGTGRGKSSLQK